MKRASTRRLNLARSSNVVAPTIKWTRLTRFIPPARHCLQPTPFRPRPDAADGTRCTSKKRPCVCMLVSRLRSTSPPGFVLWCWLGLMRCSQHLHRPASGHLPLSVHLPPFPPLLISHHTCHCLECCIMSPTRTNGGLAPSHTQVPPSRPTPICRHTHTHTHPSCPLCR